MRSEALQQVAQGQEGLIDHVDVGVSHRQKIDIIDKRRQSKIKCGENIGQLLYIIERTFGKERENMEEAERENIILWIIDQVRQMPLGLLKQVRGFIRGITKP